MKTRNLPRNIRPENVYIGDKVRVTWTVEDVERSVTGVIGEREYQGAARVFSTLKGVELFRYIPGVGKRPVIVLLEESKLREPEMLTLF